MDPLQVFQGDATAGAYSLGDDPLADHMIDVGGKPRLCPAAFAKQPLGALGALALELLPQPAVSVTDPVHVRPTVSGTVTAGGDVDDPKVHTEHPHRALLGLLRDLAGRQQQPAAVPEQQITLAASGCQQPPLVSPAGEAHVLEPATDGPDRHRLLCKLP
jgi:hypothetical protein